MVRRLPEGSIDCVITSPPYGNLKNYGSKHQVGFGQRVGDEYFRDLESILEALHRATKPGAAVWVVLDTWRSDLGITIPLPMEFARLAVKVGFRFHDLVVWDKGK